MRNGYGMVQKIREAENEGSIEESKEGGGGLLDSAVAFRLR